VTYGLANGQVIKTNLSAAQFAANINAGLYADQIVVNAEPYTIYTAENPSNYAIGLYTGLSVLYIPQNGFQSIVINLDVTNLVS
jgi:hypothetical protein